jgi:WhiB family redox-sensing transcriptional regulator
LTALKWVAKPTGEVGEMTRARVPRPQEVAAARRDPRLLRAVSEKHDNAWRTKGVCQTVDPETFFPVPMAPADVAINLCGGCPVAGACLAWALSVGDCHGVWGGTTARERRAMLVAWRTEEAAEERSFADQSAEVTEVIVSAGELVPARRPVIAAQRGFEHTSLLTREPARASC